MNMTAVREDDTPLAALVKAGAHQAEAVRVTDFIFLAHDVSNLYLVTTADGDVLINTGFLNAGPRNKALLAPHRTGPLRRIILTQSHTDHFGGLPDFQEDGTQVIIHADFQANKQDTLFLHPFFNPRVRQLWGAAIKMDELPQIPPEVHADIVVEKDYSFEQGGRRFELLWTPDGETTDSLTVWMPQERVAFVGNLFGPVFLSMPFLNTLRGDKPRLVRSYLTSLDRIRNLGAEILITGHGDPIMGAQRIRADLDRLYAAVEWVRDYTLAGMNAGKDVDTLVREIRLPENIAIGEFHGKASWAVRSIWQEYSGWFHYDSTTALYGVPRSSVDVDLVDMAGGADVLADRANIRLGEGKPLEAIHLLDIALGAEPTNAQALTVKKSALERLLAQSGGTNLSETMWLRSEIAGVGKALG